MGGRDGARLEECTGSGLASWSRHDSIPAGIARIRALGAEHRSTPPIDQAPFGKSTRFTPLLPITSTPLRPTREIVLCSVAGLSSYLFVYSRLWTIG